MTMFTKTLLRSDNVIAEQLKNSARKQELAISGRTKKLVYLTARPDGNRSERRMYSKQIKLEKHKTKN